MPDAAARLPSNSNRYSANLLSFSREPLADNLDRKSIGSF
jgi:hypothetical protein